MALVMWNNILQTHYVKSVQIRRYFWSVFSCFWTKYRKIRTWKKLHIWTLFTQWYGPGMKYLSKMIDLNSSVTWNNLGHFPKAQDKLIFSFPLPFFYMFLTLKSYKIEPLKSPLGRSIYTTMTRYEYFIFRHFYFVFFKLSKYFLVS